MATAATAIARHYKAVAVQPPPSRPCAVASRCAWWQPHITALPCSFLLLVQSVGTACCPAQAPQSCRLVCLPVVVIARCGNTLRFYITPHCIKCMPVSRQAPLVVMHRLRALSGLRSRRYAKLPTLGAVASCRCSPVATRPTHRHLPPCGCACMVASVRRFAQCFQSAASPCHWCWPPPTLGLACFASIACAVCPSAPQGGSLRTAPKQHPVSMRRAEPCATSSDTLKVHALPQMGDSKGISQPLRLGNIRNRLSGGCCADLPWNLLRIQE